MEQSFYIDRLCAPHNPSADAAAAASAAGSLSVVLPDAAERADVHDIIFNELAHGTIRDASRRRFAEGIDRLVREAGADAEATEPRLIRSALQHSTHHILQLGMGDFWMQHVPEPRFPAASHAYFTA